MQVFVYGSRVSRDAMTLLDGSGINVAHHVTQQSLITLLGPAREITTALDLSIVQPAFRRWELERTLAARMKAELAERGHDVDMLLWDLAGEWYGVYANPEGTGYSTRLPDLISNGLDRKIGSRGRFVAFGTSEHFDLWQQGLTRWTHLLRKLGLADRVVLISPTWAPLPDDGVGLDSSELSQTDFRRLAARYARAASDSLPELRIIGRGGRSLPAMADQWRPLSATTAASSLLGIAAEIFDLVFDPTESFPLPRPSVSVLGLTAEISTRVSWGKSFALNISQGDRIVVKGKYQKEPVFSVAVPEPGKYRLRLFHRAGDHKAVVTTATEFAN